MIELPEDVTVTVTKPETTDEGTAQLLADFEQFQRVRAAVNRVQDMNDPRWKPYLVDGVRLDMKRGVLEDVDAGRALFGHWDTYDIRVTELTETTASLVHCEDQNRMGVLNPSTGEVIDEPTPQGAPPEQRLIGEQTVTFEKSPAGVWQVSGSKIGNTDGCQR